MNKLDIRTVFSSESLLINRLRFKKQMQKSFEFFL